MLSRGSATETTRALAEVDTSETSATIGVMAPAAAVMAAPAADAAQASELHSLTPAGSGAPGPRTPSSSPIVLLPSGSPAAAAQDPEHAMRQPRRLALLLPLALGAAACASFGRDGAELAASPAARFAAALEASDPVADAGVAMMDDFERRALREERAVAFAIGRAPAAPQTALPGPGAAEAAGEVIGPAFTALGDYAHVLGQAATGTVLEARPSVGGEVLAQAVAQALPATQASVPPALREAGVAGVAALARLAQRVDGRRSGPSAQDLAREAQPHLQAVGALLIAVIGRETGQATRGAIQARRAAMEAAHARLLEAARRDGGLGAGGRYALFHQIAAIRDGDPLPGTMAAIVTLLSAMEEAHVAIAAGDATAEAKVAGFEAALAALSALTGQDAAEQQ